MKKLICRLFHHKTETHLDYIYGTLPREHVLCATCGLTKKFERPSEAREQELADIGDIRDGAVGGCERL